MAGIAGGAIAQQEQPVPPFKDVPQDHWAYQAVENLRQKGILRGYPDSSLKGKRTVTRYEAAVALDRIVRGGSALRLPPSIARTPLTNGGPGPRGSEGPKGERGALGAPGPRGQAPPEVSEYRSAIEEMRKEIASLRQQLDAADTKAGKLSGESRDLKKNAIPIRTGK